MEKVTLCYNGLFYGARCSTPYIVPVPMAQYHTIPSHVDFLSTESWIDVGSRYPDCVNMEEKCVVLSTFPGSSCKLRFSYTFFTASQAITSESVGNHVVRMLSQDVSHWMGDVLVVKSTRQQPEQVVNMEQSDMELVNLLLMR
jgi:hypothetical protein